MHSYERTCAVYKNQCVHSKRDTHATVTAPVHVVIGTAGASLDEEQWLPNPEWSMFRVQEFGYSRLFVNSTTLHFQWLGNSDGALHDEFLLTRDNQNKNYHFNG